MTEPQVPYSVALDNPLRRAFARLGGEIDRAGGVSPNSLFTTRADGLTIVVCRTDELRQIGANLAEHG